MKFTKSFFVIMAVFAGIVMMMSGCAFTPQAIRINPTVDIPSSQVGRGHNLFLNVVDERPKKTLGTVGASNVGADISIEGDLTLSIQNSIADGLSRLTFKPITRREESKTELRVEIRNIDYTIITGFWAGTLRVDVGLKGICIRDTNRLYEKLYHGEYSESIQVVKGQDANTQYINTAISAAVKQLLSDQELIDCLVK